MTLFELLPIASFTSPMEIGTTPFLALWMLPLAGAIAIIYKVIKIQKIKPLDYFKQSLILFASIVVFIAISAVVLLIIDWFFIQ